MIRHIQLRQFALSGDWLPLISCLNGWKEVEEDLFSDGESCIALRRSDIAPPAIGFVYSGEARNRPALTLESPSGLLLKVTERPVFMRAQRQVRFIMNHAAFQVPATDVDRLWLEKELGQCTILARESTWDPVARTWWPDAHLFSPPDFYLTLRGDFESVQVDHIGWMTDSMDAIDDISVALAKIGWPILFGPDHIDGSYLVHFRGPDERVHDFFYPTPAVMPKLSSP